MGIGRSLMGLKYTEKIGKIQTVKELGYIKYNFSSVQSLSHVRHFATLWTAARQVSLSITSSQSLLKLMCIQSVTPSNHLILCHPLLLLPSIFPSIRVFSNESALRIRWPNYWSFSFIIHLVIPMNIQDWFPLGLTGLIPLQIKYNLSIYYVPLKYSPQWKCSCDNAVEDIIFFFLLSVCSLLVEIKITAIQDGSYEYRNVLSQNMRIQRIDTLRKRCWRKWFLRLFLKAACNQPDLESWKGFFTQGPEWKT